MKKNIPNFITLLNVACGSIAIILAIYGYLLDAVYFILAGMVFDFCDGLVARLLDVKSDVGKELDSLADVVSFGMAPAALVHKLIWYDIAPGVENFGELTMILQILVFVPILIPMFSAFRLAKFNLDTRQTTSFIGMPVPAHALFWIGVVVLNYIDNESYSILFNTWTIVVCVVILSVLLISGLPMFSLKISGFGRKGNGVRYIYFGSVVLVAAFFGKYVLISMIPLYILICAVKALIGNNEEK